ncbi:MAG: metalloregulator ArsR/SmtB family transcription factor [Planctomycetota bacterium]
MASSFSAARARAAAPLFAALGDPTRLALVARLSRGGPESIGNLSEGAGVSRQAVAKHLRVLSDAGLVRGARDGRRRVFRLLPRRLADARGHLERIDAQWDEALSRLKDFVEEGD